MWGANDRRSKHFCSNAVLCVGLTWRIVKTRVIRLRGGRRSKHAWSNCLLCIPFILSGSPNKLLAIRHFEVARETRSRWWSSALWDRFGGRIFIVTSKLSPKTVPQCTLTTVSTQSPTQPQSGEYTCDACVITTWRLRLRAPLIALNYSIIENITVNSFQYGCLWDAALRVRFRFYVRLIESQLKGVINFGTSSKWPSCMCQLPGRVRFSNRVMMSAL